MRKKLKNKRGLSEVITIVLITLLVIASIAIIFTATISFIKKSSNESESGLKEFKGEVGFIIRPVTYEDTLYDRVRIQNTGQETLTNFSVKIDNQAKEVIKQKNIKTQESKYLYLKDTLPSGEHTITVSSSGVTRELEFGSSEDWHISINNALVE